MAESWIQEQEKIEMFGPGYSGADASLLLQKTKTNKLISGVSQGKTLAVLRILQARYENLYPGRRTGYSLFGIVADIVEETQLTMDGYSREQFIKLASVQRANPDQTQQTQVKK